MSKRIEVGPDKKILDVTCGMRSIWFDKHHPAAIYCDKRKEHFESDYGSTLAHRTVDVSPDVVCDFTDLPFDDESFYLVIFDPPHASINENAWIAKEYGSLRGWGGDWQQMLHDGFAECMRVLKPNGTLIFKWSEIEIPAGEVWKAIGQKPLFGHHSGRKNKTFWGCFMKLEGEINE